MTPGRMVDRHKLLESLNTVRRELDHDVEVRNYTAQQEKAFTLLSSSATSGAFDIASESPATLERYGKTINGTSLLMARRLVEAGCAVRHRLLDGERRNCKPLRQRRRWDTHANNFNCLRDNLLPEFDRGFSALMEDLSQRDC